MQVARVAVYSPKSAGENGENHRRTQACGDADAIHACAFDFSKTHTHVRTHMHKVLNSPDKLTFITI